MNLYIQILWLAHVQIHPILVSHIHVVVVNARLVCVLQPGEKKATPVVPSVLAILLNQK